MATRKRTPTFFEAETRVIGLDSALLSLSEDTSPATTIEPETMLEPETVIELDRPKLNQNHDAETVIKPIPTRRGETTLPRAKMPQPRLEATVLTEALRAETTLPIGDKPNLAEGSESGNRVFNRDDYQLASFSQVMTALRDQPGKDLAATCKAPRLAHGSGPVDAFGATIKKPESFVHRKLEAAPNNEQTELRPTTHPAGPYCSVRAPELAVYQITREIAGGGMGIVYEAYHRQSQKRVAVKYMREVSAQQAKLVKRFLGEGIAVSRIDHPGVPEIYDYGHDNDGVPYLVMEYLEGENLGDRLARGPLTPTEFLEIGLQLVEILAIAHKLGIVHRDLKPDNIFLLAGQSTRVKLLDFGVAKFLDDQHLLGATSDGQVLGTPFYMSPEQCAGGNVDTRSDIYSLGCVFYQMLAGKVPFSGNIFDVVLGHRQKKPLPLNSLCANLPPALVHLIEKMMEKSPDERLASVSQVGSELAAIAAGKRHVEVPTTQPRKRRSRASRNSVAPRQRPTRHGLAAMQAKPRARRSLISITVAALVLVSATAMTVGMLL